MSSTNKTANYELSQFLGSDKPAWLSDYNSDMGKIDAQMKLNADSASSASGASTANTAAIGTLASLTTDDKATLVNAINEVDAHADTAQSTASSASTAASTANAGVSSINAYLNLNTFSTIQPSSMSISGTGSIRAASSSLTIAKNAAGSLGKVYGNIVVDCTAGSSFTVTVPSTGLLPDEAINIKNAGFITLETSNGVRDVDVLSYSLDTSGNLTVTTTPSTNIAVLKFIACLIFVKNFGD